MTKEEFDELHYRHHVLPELVRRKRLAQQDREDMLKGKTVPIRTPLDQPRENLPMHNSPTQEDP